jgi:transposase-like protein
VFHRGVLCFAEYVTRIYSTKPLGRVNKEVKRRTNIVGVS